MSVIQDARPREGVVAASGHGTGHFLQHKYTGWGVIVGLPFVLVFAALAVAGGEAGLIGWLSTALGAVGFLAFVTAALWYCKLEMDEVIMDYADTRGPLLTLNALVALVLWAAIAYSVVTLAFL